MRSRTDINNKGGRIPDDKWHAFLGSQRQTESPHLILWDRETRLNGTSGVALAWGLLFSAQPGFEIEIF